jgi:ABC-type bacteriocin/lantibiotic exporter with double-glycine peptidase domain
MGERRMLLCILCAIAIVMLVASRSPGIRGRAIGLAYGGHYLDDSGVIRQAGLHDCGVAAIAMLTNGSDSTILPAWSTRVAGRGRGLSLFEIEEITEDLGRPLIAFQLSLGALLIVPKPLIAHMGRHYVVVDRADSVLVTFRDPLGARIEVPLRAFSRRWSGFALVRSAIRQDGNSDDTR